MYIVGINLSFITSNIHHSIALIPIYNWDISTGITQIQKYHISISVSVTARV